MPSPAPPPAAPHRARRRLRAAVALLAAPILALALAVAGQALWLGPAIRHYVSAHSGRRIDFDRVRVRFAPGLDPTIEFDGLFIENAPWADRTRPLIRARHLEATLDWRTLLARERVVTLVVLDGAQVDLERQADGLRNWRLGHPDDRGPPRARLLALDARDSRLHTVQGALALEADVQIAPLPRPRTLAAYPGLPLTRRLVFDGRWKGLAFDGASAVGDVLTFGGTSRRFPLDAEVRVAGLRVAGLRIAAAGTANDLHRLDDFDVDVHMADDAGAPAAPASSSAEARPPAWRETLARLRPLRIDAHLDKSGPTWTATALQAAFGRHGALAGQGRFIDDRRDGRHGTVEATVREATLDLDDLRAFAGHAAAAAGSSARAGEPRLLSATAWPTAPLREIDADLDLQDARLVGAPRALAPTLRLRATLRGGRLDVSTIDLGLADGHVTGALQFDGSRPMAALALQLQARGLRVDRLSARLAADQGLAGAINGRATLRAQGDSARALAADASGTIDASLAPGASVSARLDAKLGLDGGAWLRSLFGRGARVPVRCAAVSLAIEHGVGVTRRLVFETARTTLAGSARVDFADQTLDALVTPVHTTPALLTLDKALHASGPWRDLHVALAPPAAGGGDPVRRR